MEFQYAVQKEDRAEKETDALNEQVNLYGFIDPHAFLTKSGDVGIVLQVNGVDYECPDGNALDTLTKRLEAVFRPSRLQNVVQIQG